MKKTQKKDTKNKVFAQNKYARFQYEIMETIEAGIELLGTEVKSIRNGKVNLRDGFCSFNNNEILLKNVHISPHTNVGTFFNHDPLRDRKLLIHKIEIYKLQGRTEKKGLTIVPLSIYLKGSLIKLKIGVGKAKKLHDKRNVQKNRDMDREAKRAIKNYK